MTLQLARYLPEKPFNADLPRFHPEFWTIDYNALMVGTIIPINARGFRIPGQWRTNSDFMGVRWQSEDHYNHEWFRYATDNNYETTILAFRANPAEPTKFTVTITQFDVPYTYRLCPYVLNPTTNRWEPLDPDYNPGRTYPANVIIPQAQWTDIPDDEMVAYRGRKDYIFILDFDDLRIYSRYDGPKIDPRDIKMISFDTLEWSHGLGRDATINEMTQEGAELVLKVTGAVPGAVLSVGDRLTFLARFNVPQGNSFGGPTTYRESLPPPTGSIRQGTQRWPVTTSRTHYLNVGGQIERIPDTPASVIVTARRLISPDGRGSTGFVESFTHGPFPVTGWQQTSPTVVAVTYDCSSDPNWVDPYLLGLAYAEVYVTVNYQEWGVGSSEQQITVSQADGFGTGEWTIRAPGTIPGPFIECDAFYSRYLQVTSPAEVTNSNKYFVDMTVGGTRTKIRRRFYPQPAHDLMMTSGFDDGYNLSAARQVDMVYNLGYRGWWTKYQGMSHYFNGRTAWQDKVTGEIIAPGRTSDVTVMYAGDHTISAHFIMGRRPNRGADMFAQHAAALFGVSSGQVIPINGATGSTSTDRAAAVNPDNTQFDPEAGSDGGLWYWDYDADQPGPALLQTMNRAVAGNPPRAVVWALGAQDMQALKFAEARDPMPTLQRTKESLKKIFAYMREKWGANLPIIIQGIGWIWTADAKFTAPGTPIYLSVARNSWGDVVFNWLVYNEDPADKMYRIDIFSPINPTEIMRSITVPGTQVSGGVLYCDYPNELNVPDAVAAFGDQFPWNYLRWQVTRLDANEDLQVVSSIAETIVPEDNTAFVKKTVLLGINSLIGGYFNDLSDPLNPGGTGRPGRKDVVAASTFRKTFAANAGLRDVEVLPVMVVVGSSPINPMPYQEGFPLDNYWWDPVNKVPGPNLLIADQIVRDLGVVPDYFVESGPGETTGIAYADPADRPAILAAWRQSNIEMLAWQRANWGNPTMEIWFQGATTSWWGDPPPVETNALGAELLRDLQTSMAKEGIGFKMGSYVPNANLYTTYANEMALGVGWVHYTVAGYHAAAAEMGEAMALNLNRAYTPPDWTMLKQPKNLHAAKQINGDIVYTWDPREGISNWWVVNRRGDDNSPLFEGAVSTNSYTFTKADQEAAYGSEASFVNFDVGEHIPGIITGPMASYVGNVGDDSGLQMPNNLVANKQLNGDITFTWTGRAGYNIFYIINRDVRSGEPPIQEGQISGTSFTFTRAKQIERYGFEVLYVNFLVSEVEGTSVGPAAEWNGDAISPLNPMNPVTGFEAIAQGGIGFSDVKFVWNPSPTPGRKFRVVNRHAGTGDAISTTITAGTELLFTQAQQIAAYGFRVTSVLVDICEYDEVNNVSGTIYTYNGPVT